VVTGAVVVTSRVVSVVVVVTVVGSSAQPANTIASADRKKPIFIKRLLLKGFASRLVLGFAKLAERNAALPQSA
jgi:hypothetical protein